MSLQDCRIKTEYRSLIDHIVKDFYIPLLTQAAVYKRAVGFFSSTSLVQITKGITTIAKNNGSIQIVASPYLSDDDLHAIKAGYDSRENIVKKALLKELPDTIDDYYAIERLNLLANLIADGILDIRIAFIEDKNGIGMYHEKMGIIEDIDGNKVAFSGSMNESVTALTANYETIDVFCNWMGAGDAARVDKKENAFCSIWNNCEPGINVMKFPEISQAIITKYKKKAPNYLIDQEEFENKLVANELNKKKQGARIPKSVSLYDYQIEAINEWEKQSFCGIFDMATGTGKTFTGLGAISSLSESVDDNLAVIIVCPYQHLVEQWVSDIINFNMKPIIGYSSSPQKDWKKQLETAIRNQTYLDNKRFFCFVTTTATFASEYVQKQIKRIRKPICLVADEAHNLGTERLLELLDDKYKYRLALSATLKRHFDDIGTTRLCNFFGEKCIEYTLDKAIDEGKLTPYKYYPIVVTLDENELQAFQEITQKMLRCIITDRHGHCKLNDAGVKLAIKRARLVAGANAKIDALKKVITPFKDDYYMLVYCGATTLNSYEKDYSVTNNDDLRQIETITRLLGNELRMNVSKFTADENMAERRAIKEYFETGKDLQAIVAIKCLDEGVNIPAIQKAFILASTTNPKEYIQRRGRVLRLSPQTGKRFAEIYDFITLPRGIDETYGLTKADVMAEASLARNEVKRLKEFSRLAMNPVESYKLIDEISEAYYINESNEEEGVVDGFDV